MSEENLNPQEKTYTEQEWKGLLADKTNEVRMRQQLQADKAAMDQKIAEQRIRIKELEASTVEGKTGDPDDIMTRAEVKKMLAVQKEELTKEYTTLETQKSQESLNRSLYNSEQKAREIHTEEKEGKGLDYDSVMAGLKRQIEENPGYTVVIQKAKNPGEKAYQLGLQDPIIAKRLETNKKTLPLPGITSKEGMKGNKVPGTYYTPKMVQDMSDEELDLHYDDVLESQKRWGGQK